MVSRLVDGGVTWRESSNSDNELSRNRVSETKSSSSDLHRYKELVSKHRDIAEAFDDELAPAIAVLSFGVVIVERPSAWEMIHAI